MLQPDLLLPSRRPVSFTTWAATHRSTRTASDVSTLACPPLSWIPPITGRSLGLGQWRQRTSVTEVPCALRRRNPLRLSIWLPPLAICLPDAFNARGIGCDGTWWVTKRMTSPQNGRTGTPRRPCESNRIGQHRPLRDCRPEDDATKGVTLSRLFFRTCQFSLGWASALWVGMLSLPFFLLCRIRRIVSDPSPPFQVHMCGGHRRCSIQSSKSHRPQQFFLSFSSPPPHLALRAHLVDHRRQVRSISQGRRWKIGWV